MDKVGATPLLEVVKTIKDLLDGDLKSPIYKGPGRKYGVPQSPDEEEDEPRKVTTEGLTAAVAYLHSRSVDVLFEFGIDGDAGLDPDLMTLQFSQGGTGLPSKVSMFVTSLDGHTQLEYCRSTTRTKTLRKSTPKLLPRFFWQSTKNPRLRNMLVFLRRFI